MSHKHHKDPVVNSIETIEDVEVKETENAVEENIGVVTDCLKLNIRKEPDKDSEVVVVATCLDELKIDYELSTGEWYAVCTAAGIEGFCMKKYIAVRQ